MSDEKIEAIREQLDAQLWPRPTADKTTCLCRDCAVAYLLSQIDQLQPAATERDALKVRVEELEREKAAWQVEILGTLGDTAKQIDRAEVAESALAELRQEQEALLRYAPMLRLDASGEWGRMSSTEMYVLADKLEALAKRATS